MGHFVTAYRPHLPFTSILLSTPPSSHPANDDVCLLDGQAGRVSWIRGERDSAFPAADFNLESVGNQELNGAHDPNLRSLAHAVLSVDCDHFSYFAAKDWHHTQRGLAIALAAVCK